MKFIFRDIGEKKFSKIVEVTGFPQDTFITEFIILETKSYMPKEGTLEIISRDGFPDPISNHFSVVHCDNRYIYTGMGSVLIYR